MTFGRKMLRGLRTALSLLSPSSWKGVFEAPSSTGKMITASNALTLSTVWACVRLVSGTISSLPFMVYKEGNAGNRAVFKAHPLYGLLHDSPNADQTALDFWQFMCVALELWGNAFARISRGTGGKIVALTPLRPDAVAVRKGADGSIRYRYVDNGKAFDVGQDEMFHVRGFGGSPLGGLSTLAFGRHSFGVAMAHEEAAGQMSRNGLRPSGVLTTKDAKTLTKEQRDDIYKYVVEPLSGDNNGKPMVLEAGLGWQSLSLNAIDAQMIESRQFSVEDGCRWFGVPPHMVGHTAGNTHLGSSIEQQTLGWLIFGLRERIKRIEQAVMKQLLTAAERLSITVEINIEGLLRADSAGRAAFYSTMVQNGIMTRNEVRRLENLPPLSGGDQLTIQSNMIPADKLGTMTSTGEAAKRSIIDWLFPEGLPSLKQKEDA